MNAIHFKNLPLGKIFSLIAGSSKFLKIESEKYLIPIINDAGKITGHTSANVAMVGEPRLYRFEDDALVVPDN